MRCIFGMRNPLFLQESCLNVNAITCIVLFLCRILVPRYYYYYYNYVPVATITISLISTDFNAYNLYYHLCDIFKRKKHRICCDMWKMQQNLISFACKSCL
ncbi:hypothetical protein WUBG_01584, partial [Wuchereria bancrofti]